VKASKKLFQGNPRAFDADYPLDDADFSRLVDRIESTPLSLYAQVRMRACAVVRVCAR
jgi:hypothetical protein